MIDRLCRRDPRSPAPLRRWWLPTIGFSAEKSLQWSPDGTGFSDATTFWLTLSFQLPSGVRAPSLPERGRFAQLCIAARRLNRAMVKIRDTRVRMRGGLQLMAWRDELEAMVN